MESHVTSTGSPTRGITSGTVGRGLAASRLAVLGRALPGGFGRLRWFGVPLGVLFVVAALSACGGGSDSGRTAMSLDEYVAEACAAATTGELGVDFALDEFAAAAAEQRELMESISPPEEVAGWHDAVLAYLTSLDDALAEVLESEGGEPSEEVLFGVVFELAMEHGPALESAEGALAPEVRERLGAAGCLDGEDVSDFDDEDVRDFDDEDVPDQPTPAPGEAPEEQAPAPASPAPTIDEYAVACAAYVEGEIPEDATNGEISAAMAHSIGFMESINPPPELADLHGAIFAYATDIKFIADAQPPDEVASPFPFLVVLPKLADIEAAMDDLDPGVRARLAALGCLSDEDAATPGLVSEPPSVPPSPANVTYAVEGSSIRLNWDPVAGADHYNVYYDPFAPSCWVDIDGDPEPCTLLAGNVVDTTLVHSSPALENYYWVAACDRDGCSVIDSATPARPIEPRPANPSNVTYSVEGSSIRLSWGPVAGADSYRVYYDDFFDSGCSLDLQGRPALCTELAADVAGTTFVHANPAEENHYWVVACNRGGCSDIDSRNPVTPPRRPETPPAPPRPASAPNGTEPAPPPPPVADDAPESRPDAPESRSAAPAAATVHECPATWADAPTLTVAEVLDACGGDAAALRGSNVEECAAEELARSGDQSRANAEQSRANAGGARERAERAAADGNEDLAEHYEDLADHHEELAQHHLDLAADAEDRERGRRDRVMASLGVTTWEEACQVTVDRVWAVDYTEITSAARRFVAQLVLLSDQICGGVNADIADLCGGVDLLIDSLAAVEGGLDALVGGVGSVTGALEAATGFFGF